MQLESNYKDFIKSRGIPLSEINPGSSELALSVEDALFAIELLDNSQTIILGGDIISNQNGNLGYAIHLWGYDYHYLNWYCDRLEREIENEYRLRSYIVAKESIGAAHLIAKKMKSVCYIALVVA